MTLSLEKKMQPRPRLCDYGSWDSLFTLLWFYYSCPLKIASWEVVQHYIDWYRWITNVAHWHFNDHAGAGRQLLCIGYLFKTVTVLISWSLPESTPLFFLFYFGTFKLFSCSKYIIVHCQKIRKDMNWSLYTQAVIRVLASALSRNERAMSIWCPMPHGLIS